MPPASAVATAAEAASPPPLPDLLYFHKPSLATAGLSEEVGGSVPVQLSWLDGWLLGLPLTQGGRAQEESSFNASVSYTVIR